jgi:hypothetical protein
MRPLAALEAIVKFGGKRRPWWLKREARIDWDTRVSHDDAFVIRACDLEGIGLDAKDTSVEDYVSGEEVRATGHDGALVDLVMVKMRRLLALLRPETPTDEMISLAMQAVQDDGAMAVLTDALLDDGILPTIPEAYWLPRDVARQSLTILAHAWAKQHILERWAASDSPSDSND